MGVGIYIETEYSRYIVDIFTFENLWSNMNMSYKL